MTTATYLFTGSIITRQPLAYSPPDHAGKNGASLLPRMTVPTDAGPIRTVFLSGSTIRGRLRHCCADAYLSRRKGVTYDYYLMAKVGGVKSSATEGKVGLLDRKAFLEKEPLLDLFGAGTSPINWISGRIDVGAAIPSDPVEPIRLNGVRKDATQDPILLEVLDPAERDRVLTGQEANAARSRAAATASELEREIKAAKKAKRGTDDLEKALKAINEEAESLKRQQADILGTDVSLLMPIAGYEAIPAGTILAHRMMLKGVTETQLAIFMAGLSGFAEDPRFGAHRAHGCGSVALSYSVKELHGTQAKTVGEVLVDPQRWDQDDSSLSLTGAPAEWLAAWERASDAAQ